MGNRLLKRSDSVKRHVMFINVLILLLSISSYVNATPIRYDLIGGVDNFGNPFSGYMDFERPDGIIGDYGYPESSFILYNIVGFNFETTAGSFCGDSGYLQYPILTWPELPHPLPEYWGPILYYYGSDGKTWFNEQVSVEFVGVEPTVEGYSTLPQTIFVNTDFFVDWDNLDA